MTLSVDAAQRQSIVPLQQTASSAISRAFDLRFVTGSHYMILFIMRKPYYTSILTCCVVGGIFVILYI